MLGGFFIFTEQVISAFKESGQEEDLFSLQKILDGNHERYIYKLIPLPSRPERLLGQNGLYFIQNSLWRSKTLIEGYILSINHENSLMAALAARAHFEITGAIAFFLKRLLSFYSENMTYEALEESLRKLTLGIKTKDLLTEHAPDPINVMSMIDAADDLFKKKLKIKEKMFRRSYDDLSEFCHPNSFGLTLGSTINKIGVVRYAANKGSLNLSAQYFLPNFLITADAFLMFYDEAYKLLLENEQLPIIVKQP